MLPSLQNILVQAFILRVVISEFTLIIRFRKDPSCLSPRMRTETQELWESRKGKLQMFLSVKVEDVFDPTMLC